MQNKKNVSIRALPELGGGGFPLPEFFCNVFSTFQFGHCPNLGGGFTLARIFLQLFPIGYFPLKEVYFDQRFILAALKSVFGIIGQSRDEFLCL